MLHNFILGNIYRNLILGSYIIFFFICFNYCLANNKDVSTLVSNNIVDSFSSDYYLNIEACDNLFYSNKSKYPIIELNDGNKIIYYFYTSNIVDLPAYAGKPLELLIGLSVDGVIEDISLIKHSEPILLAGIPLYELYDAVNFYKKKNIMQLSFSEVDIITGATVTSCILDETILSSSKIISSDLGIISFDYSSKKNLSKQYKSLSWEELLACGAVGHYEFSSDVDEQFIDLYYTNIKPVSIGKNLFIDSEYDNLIGDIEKDFSYLLLLSNGTWSFKGSAFSRGGIYDRFVLSQNGNDLRFRYSDYVNVNSYKLRESVPYFKESGLFIIKNNQFNLTSPWKLVLLLFNEVNNVKNYVTLSIDYQIPSKFIESEPSKYRQTWLDNIYNIILYCLLWLFVVIIFVFREYFSNKYNILSNIKLFLYFISVSYFGFFCWAQPSVVNIFALADQNVSFFLFSPLLFIGWLMIFFTLFIWGRSFFCGWICPFGGLQELLFKIRIVLSKYKHSFEFSDKIHSYFRLFRYYIFVFLFLISFLYSSEAAELFAEIEPFKTVWNIGIFKRIEYEFVIYSIILLVVSIFIYRFFCRYICPLGAFLSLLSKFSLIKIKRRNTCGFCKICAKHCESKAINSKGEIDAFECLACFSCINKMYDNKICPPLVNNKIWIKYEESGKRN